MTSLVRRQEITANNLANVNTTGFRRSRVFEQVLENTIADDGIPYSARSLYEEIDQSEGAIEFSDRALDVAIIGDGFFVVSDTETGTEHYTRSGRFQRDADGQLTDARGNIVLGDAGPLTLPPDTENVVVGPEGQVSADGRQIGSIRIVTFTEGEEFERLDGSTFATASEPETIEHPQLRQRYIELSNVNAMTELSDMITTSRMFESQQRALRAIDQSLERATRDLGSY